MRDVWGCRQWLRRSSARSSRCHSVDQQPERSRIARRARPRQWRRTALLSAALVPRQPPATPALLPAASKETEWSSTESSAASGLDFEDTALTLRLPCSLAAAVPDPTASAPPPKPTRPTTPPPSPPPATTIGFPTAAAAATADRAMPTPASPRLRRASPLRPLPPSTSRRRPPPLPLARLACKLVRER
ncbi:hypothetical protein [Oryza sativa Japonica Group]|uniref:Uncharacterized protein n=1 Tax=Oryza sativa subsp. japonica TaxID=39947 RepID=Q5VM87_ORYSJ|nr:hypothetical protein [Oryza sativa Japonica Group]BAD69438.1 hypothetical protein [Oryza sativa Japonica Group]